MANLAQQLKRLKFAEEAKTGRLKYASILFDEDEAARTDNATVCALGETGFEQLLSLRPELSKFSFLFGPSSTEIKRDLDTEAANKKLDSQLESFCLQISQYFLLTSTQKALEWLIRRFDVHDHCAKHLIFASLPYHSTEFFVRVVSLVQLENLPHWSFLGSVQSSQQPLQLPTLQHHFSKDHVFRRDLVSLLNQSFAITADSNFLCLLSNLSIKALSLQADADLVASLLPVVKTLIVTDSKEHHSTALAIAISIGKASSLGSSVICKLLQSMSPLLSTSLTYETTMSMSLLAHGQTFSIDAETLDQLSLVQEELIKGLTKLSTTHVCDTFVTAIISSCCTALSSPKAITLLERMCAHIVLNKVQASMVLKAIFACLSESKTSEQAKNTLVGIVSAMDSVHGALIQAHILALHTQDKLLFQSVHPKYSMIQFDGQERGVLALALLDSSVYKRQLALNFISSKTYGAEHRDGAYYLYCSLQVLRHDEKSLVLTALKIVKSLMKFGDPSMILSALTHCSQRFTNAKSVVSLCASIAFNEVITSAQNLGSLVLSHFLPLLMPGITGFHIVAQVSSILADSALLKLYPSLESLLDNQLLERVNLRTSDAFAIAIEKHYEALFTGSKMNALVHALASSDDMVHQLYLLTVFSFKPSPVWQKLSHFACDILRDSTVNPLNQLPCPEDVLSSLLFDILSDLKSNNVTLAKQILCLQLLNSISLDDLTDENILNDDADEYLAQICACLLCAEQIHCAIPAFQVLLSRISIHPINFLSAIVLHVEGSPNDVLQGHCLQVIRSFVSARSKASSRSDLEELEDHVFGLLPTLLMSVMSSNGACRKEALSLVNTINNARLPTRNKNSCLSSLLPLIQRHERDLQQDGKCIIQILEGISGQALSGVKKQLFPMLQKLHRTRDMARFLAFCKAFSDPRILSIIMEPLSAMASLDRDLSKEEDHFVDQCLDLCDKRLFQQIQSNDVCSKDCLKTLQLAITMPHSSHRLKFWSQFAQNFQYLSRDLQFSIMQVSVDRFVIDGSKNRQYLVQWFRDLILSGDLLADFIEQTVQQQSSPKATKRRKTSKKNTQSRQPESHYKRISAITYLLHLKDPSSIPGIEHCLATLFGLISFLNSCSESSMMNAWEATAHCLDFLARALDFCIASNISAAKDAINAAPVVHCLRNSPFQSCQQAALLVLVAVGRLLPTKLVDSVLPIFMFLGNHTLRYDDDSSLSLVEQTVDHVIPILTDLHDEDSIQRKIQVIGTFVDNFEFISPHRNVPLFSRIIHNLGIPESLTLTTALFFKRHVMLDLKSEEFTAKSFASVDVKESHSGKIYAFLANLLRSFELGDQLQDLDEILHTFQTVAFTNDFDTPSSKVLDPEVTTPKQRRHYCYLILSHVVHHLSDSNFLHCLATTNLSEKDQTQMFTAIIQRLLSIIDKSSTTTPKPCAGTSQFWSQVVAQAYLALGRIMAFASDSSFAKIMSSFLHNESNSIRTRACRMLSQRLAKTPDDRLINLSGLVDDVFNLLPDFLEGAVSPDLIVSALALCNSIFLKFRDDLGSDCQILFEKISSLCRDFIQDCKFDVLSCCLSTLGIAASSLKATVLPYIPNIASAILSVLVDALKIMEDSSEKLDLITLLQTGVESMKSLYGNYAKFMGPYVVETIAVLTQPQFLDVSPSLSLEFRIQQEKLISKTRNLLSICATECRAHTILPALYKRYQDILHLLKSKISVEWVNSLSQTLKLLHQIISSLNSSVIKVQGKGLLKFFLSAFDTRTHLVPTTDCIETIETSLLECFGQFVLQLSDAAFRPIFLQLVDWANRPSARRPARLATLFHAMEQLCGILQQHFVHYFSHVMQLSSDILTGNLPLENHVEAACAYVLRSFKLCFDNDDSNFLTKSRFSALVPGIVHQLEMRSGEALEAYQSRIETDLIPCTLSFAVRIGTEQSWRILNREIFSKTRSGASIVRVKALRLIEELQNRLGEEYLGLLPDSILFLAELLEDDDIDVERQTKQVVKIVEEILGEPLSKYF